MDTSRLLASYNNHIPTHQHQVGVGRHVQLRLRGNLTLTSIIQHPHTNTSSSGRRGAPCSAGAEWSPHAYKHHHLNQIAIQLLEIKSQTYRQTDRHNEQSFSIIPFTSYPSNLVSSPSHHDRRLSLASY